jgi:ATP-dependent helicase HepA
LARANCRSASLIIQLAKIASGGRVSFRNTRATVHGFPARVPQIAPLKPDVSRHERIDWLIRILREVEPDKVLLICRTQAKVAAIETALRERLKNVEAAVFHEGLSLLQRDRNAAWFADVRGARLLICSEIGSEGRNFQFAHHLVLFDLPLDPEVLEQRIGRLDRIGQKTEIQVHVPYVLNGGQEVLTRWFHEGLNAFARNLEGGNEILERFGARVHDLTQHFLKTKLQTLIEDTKTPTPKSRSDCTKDATNCSS